MRSREWGRARESSLGGVQVGVLLDHRPQVLLVGDPVGFSDEFGPVVGVGQLEGPVRVVALVHPPLGKADEPVLVGQCDRVLVFVVDLPAHA